MTGESVRRIEIPKSSVERIVVERKTYKGTEVGDIRTWYVDDPSSPEWKPTRRGVCFRVELFPDVLAALGEIAPAEDEDNG